MESAFKKEEHPFRVAIVCAMWLTGFDVPTLSTLYLDKPLKAHTLMQASQVLQFSTWMATSWAW
jgi:type I restriction enzyme R subunit